MSLQRKRPRVICMAILLAVIACLLTGCVGKKNEAITSLDQLGKAGTRIGTGSDLTEWETLQADYPEAKVIAYSDISLALEDVARGRLDAYVYDRRQMELAIESGIPGIRLLDEDYRKNTIVIGISPVSPIDSLREKINAFIAEKKADGTLDEMFDRWVVRSEEAMPEIPRAENPAFTLKVGTTGTVMPYSYYVGTELNGYDIELAYRFAAWLGARVEFKVYDFSGIPAACASGDVDCVMSNLFYTKERAETMLFSDSVFEVNMTAAVRDDGTADQSLTFEDLQNAPIAVLMGSLFPEIVKENIPDAELLYFNSVADELNAVKTEKADATVVDTPVARSIQAADSSLKMLPDEMGHFENAFILTKSERGQELCDKLSEYIRGLKADGTLEKLQTKWFDAADPAAVETTDYRNLPAENGIIRVATMDYIPFIYAGEEIFGGYEIEILAMFCRDCGYGLEIDLFDNEAIIPAVQSGKCDIGCDCISITDERKESVLFSEPNYIGGTSLIVRNEAGQSDQGFFASFRDGFNKTFIRENRWKLFVEGIGTTMLITAMSILFGTALGFGVYMMCRKGNPIANTIARFCVWLVQGMPIVVLLMILYYIVFGDVKISGSVVSIVGFTLVFGSSVFAMLKSGVGAIDIGQTEAAYALGYTERRTFYRVILPQALPHFMPAYKGEITALIKATAVVGYVAVQDLTKMGDIVRGRTYDAFFPLIAVAVIYFILAAVLTFIVNKIEIQIDPRKRSRDSILKGVDVK